mgnify:FL=1
MIIGYTTGVFDLFHKGHLDLLKNAKALCDELIVGVTTDELSITFKNKKPVVPFDERLYIVSGIRYVDKAVVQSTMNKYEAWKQYKFNILFASSNPTGKWAKVEKEFLNNFKKGEAPRIVYLPYTPGVSSSERRMLLGGLK